MTMSVVRRGGTRIVVSACLGQAGSRSAVSARGWTIAQSSPVGVRRGCTLGWLTHYRPTFSHPKNRANFCANFPRASCTCDPLKFGGHVTKCAAVLLGLGITGPPSSRTSPPILLTPRRNSFDFRDLQPDAGIPTSHLRRAQSWISGKHLRNLPLTGQRSPRRQSGYRSAVFYVKRRRGRTGRGCRSEAPSSVNPCTMRLRSCQVRSTSSPARAWFRDSP
jgi:hypothetical protein